jgi:hypothetical protein
MNKEGNETIELLKGLAGKENKQTLTIQTQLLIKYVIVI